MFILIKWLISFLFFLFFYKRVKEVLKSDICIYYDEVYGSELDCEVVYFEDFFIDFGFVFFFLEYVYWDSIVGEYVVEIFDNFVVEYWVYLFQFLIVSGMDNVIIFVDILCENGDWGIYFGV